MGTKLIALYDRHQRKVTNCNGDMDNQAPLLYRDSHEDDFSSASSTSIALVIETNPLDDDEICSVRPNSDALRIVQDVASEEKLTVSSKSSNKISRTKIPISKTRKVVTNDKIDEEEEEKEEEDEDVMIPLYGGEKNVSEVNFLRNNSSSSSRNLLQDTPPCSKRSFRFASKTRCKFTLNVKTNNASCSSLASLMSTKTPAKSYVSIFHNRIGYPNSCNVKKNEQVGDTVRSIYGDDTSRSVIGEESETEQFQDAEGYDSDSTSFYLRHIENEKAHKGDASSSLQSCQTITDTISLSLIENLCNLHTNKLDEKNITLKKSNPKKHEKSVTNLSKLAVDTGSISTFEDKLERRKKQLSYGQKVSNRNRIKMIENNVLKVLKNEIEKSNSLR